MDYDEELHTAWQGTLLDLAREMSECADEDLGHNKQ